ncbi:MAG: hypothetical protein WCN87_00730 [Chlamydiota bacterium]
MKYFKKISIASLLCGNAGKSLGKAFVGIAILKDSLGAMLTAEEIIKEQHIAYQIKKKTIVLIHFLKINNYGGQF